MVMNIIDRAIFDVDEVICGNINFFNRDDRGILSQNILGQIRNFTEYVIIKVTLGNDIDPNDYEINKQAMEKLRQNGKLRFLYCFHEMLQKSVSHYTFDKESSERLMLKYYEYLLKIKKYLKENYNLEVLHNLSKFPLNVDSELEIYYKKIVEKIENPSEFRKPIENDERYYVQKVKPFFISEEIFYEVTLTTANSYVSKFDRVICFTKCDIVDIYAIKFKMHTDQIDVFGKEVAIYIIDEYEISIRQCEFTNLSKKFGCNIHPSTSSNEYKGLMKFLTESKMPLTELISSERSYYECVKQEIIENARSVLIFPIFDKCRDIVLNNKPGSNVLRYLLYNMNNKIIRSQYSFTKCVYLSDLYLCYGCIPFDTMPFCTSLCEHNPRLYDLFLLIPSENRTHELFARYIKNNTEIEGKLFTSINEINGFEGYDIDKLIRDYNRKLYYKHVFRKLEKFNNHIYLKGYVADCEGIITRLQQLTESGIDFYKNTVNDWLNKTSLKIDDDTKKNIIREMFVDSKVAVIYGAAGTGKTTLVNYVSDIFFEYNKLFLANTNPAVDNLQRKIKTKNSCYKTISKFLTTSNKDVEYDILFIDECSTVSNKDMMEILNKASFKLLVLVGDIYQIESILFGNWFTIIQNYLPQNSIFELTTAYRTDDEKLLTLWDRVRKFEDSILEFAVKNKYTARLDETIFEKVDDDEIILCLNYDGLYGINNMNRFLQYKNPNKSYVCGLNTYKEGDPVLFNETDRLSSLIHNNSKGTIYKINEEYDRIEFYIELEEAINGLDAKKYDICLVGQSKNNKSIISFYVNKFRNSDEDEHNGDLTIVPFQVAYAISIHKAQGLEYKSVKVVISNEVEEKITHNIFYTAITRTRKYLTIYWSPETEKTVLGKFDPIISNKDSILLSKLCSLKTVMR